MALYEQRSGGHAAHRVQPEPGSDLEKQLQGLAEAGEDNWVRVEDAEPEPDAPKKPRKNSSQEAWAAWAIAQGADEAEAKGADRDALIAAYGG